MHPRLGEWGGVTFYSYGTCLVLSAPVCLLTLAVLLKRRQSNLSPAVDLSVLALVAYWPGARLLNGIMTGGGMTLEGSGTGVWGGQLVFGGLSALYLLLSSVQRRDTSDALAVAWAALTVPVKLGCFLAGCCHGAPTTSPLAVRFSAESFCRMPGQLLHPTQLYDAGAAFLIAVLLGIAYLCRKSPGRLILWFGLCYAASKFVSELFRGDLRFPAVGFLHASMLVEAGTAAVCILTLLAPGPWNRWIDRKSNRAAETGMRTPGAAPLAVFGFELGLALLAMLLSLVPGAGRFVAPRSQAVYFATFLGIHLLMGRTRLFDRLGLRLSDPGGHRPGAGRLLARSMVQGLSALTILGLLRPLLDTGGRSAGDALADTRLVRFPGGGNSTSSL